MVEHLRFENLFPKITFSWFRTLVGSILCIIAVQLFLLNQLNASEQVYFAREYPVISRSLQEKIEHTSSDSLYAIWVFFTDKHLDDNQQSYQDALRKAKGALQGRTLDRRERRGLTNRLIGFPDLPVSRDYVEQVTNITGVQSQRNTSKWLNAVSLEANSAAIEEISRLPFVRKIRKVRVFHKEIPEVQQTSSSESGTLGKRTQYSLNYGTSLNQLAQINVPEVHEMGYSGRDILVLMLDTGYFKDHEAVEKSRIVAERDFIRNDTETQNDSLDHSRQDEHGTFTMTALGGAVDGTLYGPAYECEYLLAKTEIYDQEIRVEEDNFVAALEWGESLGADVVSSSVGYIDWYDFEDMDGNTTVTTLAVERAVELGMTVVTSAGNEHGGNAFWDGIISPADADSVISVGAVDIKGVITSFSSRGPTADGRIKPEVVALGKSTFCGSPPDANSYAFVDGTSLSTPLVAGVAALLLQAHPNWTPVDVRRALMLTAGNANSPNNTYGWGLVNALEAIHYQQPGGGLRFVTHNYPNPFTSRTVIDYNIPDSLSQGENVTMRIYNIRGEQVANFISPFTVGSFIWDVSTPNWNFLSTGIYLYRIQSGSLTSTGKMTLIR